MRTILFNSDQWAIYPNVPAFSDKSNECVVVKGWQDLKNRAGNMRTLLTISKCIAAKYRHDIHIRLEWTMDDLAQYTWNMMQEICDGFKNDARLLKRAARIEVAKRSRRTGTNASITPKFAKRRDYILNREAISKDLSIVRRGHIPPQARTILGFLIAQPLDILTDVELEELLLQLQNSGLLTGAKGKPLVQTAQRIFWYYESMFISRGFIKKIHKSVSL